MRHRLHRRPLTITTLLAVLAVTAPLLAAPAGAHGPDGAGDGQGTADQTTDDYAAAIDLTFPVAGHDRYTDDFDAPRGGGTRVHKATDIMAPYGAPVHAAMGGTIGWITGTDGNPPSYGYMISIDGDDGRRYSYIHLGRQDRGPAEAYAPGMADGVRVERGEHIGWSGCSGNASCDWPHLHFSIEDAGVTDPYGTNQRNPYASLVAAEERGDLPTPSAPAPVADAPRAPAPDDPATEQPDGDSADPSDEDPGRNPRDGRTSGCAPTAAVPDAPVARLAGRDPVTTSIAVSRAGWDASAAALVATAGDFADALAGAALAAERGAPLLLVDDALSTATRDELQRLGVDRVTILGGPDAVPTTVAEGLRTAVGAVDRLWGEDRFATAAAIHEHLGQDTAEIVLALGRHSVPGRSWPDAISAGALATGPAPVPVVLTEDDRLPGDTRRRLLAAAGDGAEEVWVIGGPEAIATHIDEQVEALGLRVRRLQGPTRYETSVAVAGAAEKRGGAARALVAVSGQSATDALPGGPLAARLDGTLLLVPPCSLDTVPLVAGFVHGRYGDGYVIGAESAVSERVREVLTNAISD